MESERRDESQATQKKAHKEFSVMINDQHKVGFDLSNEKKCNPTCTTFDLLHILIASKNIHEFINWTKNRIEIKHKLSFTK